MNKIFNLSEAKDRLPSLVDRAVAGEEIVVAKHGKPLATLGPIPGVRNKKPREPSNALGLTCMSDDFDAPLPPELLKLFGYDP